LNRLHGSIWHHVGGENQAGKRDRNAESSRNGRRNGRNDPVVRRRNEAGKEPRQYKPPQPDLSYLCSSVFICG
jgi:hypothetical protein